MKMLIWESRETFQSEQGQVYGFAKLSHSHLKTTEEENVKSILIPHLSASFKSRHSCICAMSSKSPLSPQRLPVSVQEMRSGVLYSILISFVKLHQSCFLHNPCLLPHPHMRAYEFKSHTWLGPPPASWSTSCCFSEKH